MHMSEYALYKKEKKKGFLTFVSRRKTFCVSSVRNQHIFTDLGTERKAVNNRSRAACQSRFTCQFNESVNVNVRQDLKSRRLFDFSQRLSK